MSSGAVDDLQVRLAPVMLGAGVRLFEFEFDGVEATRVGRWSGTGWSTHRRSRTCIGWCGGRVG
jgi:hypothetical protein